MFRTTRLMILVCVLTLSAGPLMAAQMLLVGDTTNERVLSYDLDGNFLGTFATGYKPGGLAYNPTDGYVYIADTTSSSGNNAINRYTLGGSFVDTYFTSSSTTRVDMLAVAPDGSVYFSDAFGTKQIYKVTGATTASTFVTNTFSDPGNNAGDDTLNVPRGIVFDSSGNLYLADRGDTRVLKFDSSGDLIDVLATGQTNTQGITIGSNGNLYHSVEGGGTNFLVRERQTDGTFVANIPGLSTGNEFSVGVAVADNGDVYLAGFTDQLVYKYDVSNSNAGTSFGPAQSLGRPLDLLIVTIPTPAALPAGLSLFGVLLLGRRSNRN
ncbi:hypothetical protein HED60_00480 [Planctomycetales bacterium ZRK34]|nr:hypothetical protein HED60_00480 [Planctomycetales bacterium ZRK34]